MFLENCESFGLEVGVADVEVWEVAVDCFVVVDLLGDVVQEEDEWSVIFQLDLVDKGSVLLL